MAIKSKLEITLNEIQIKTSNINGFLKCIGFAYLSSVGTLFELTPPLHVNYAVRVESPGPRRVQESRNVGGPLSQP